MRKVTTKIWTPSSSTERRVDEEEDLDFLLVESEDGDLEFLI